jgi:L-threonylcarbamoyladenylate synthase
MPRVALPELIAIARSGTDLVSFPTETIPALAARPDRAGLIFSAKQRQLDKPITLMVAQVEQMWAYVEGSVADREIWAEVAARYWPGPLTLVLPASSALPTELHPQAPPQSPHAPVPGPTIGIRIPDHPIAQAILRETGPLAATSANRSGQPALLTLAAIAQEFPQVYTLSGDIISEPSVSLRADSLETNTSHQKFIDFPQNSTDSMPRERSEEITLDHAVPSGLASTVARWTAQGWEILRQGEIVLPD